MYDLVHVLDNLTEQVDETLQEMAKCTNIDDKKKHADIVKSLCESLGVLLDQIGIIGSDYMDGMIDFDDEDPFSDDILDFNSLKKEKKRKKTSKKKKSEDDIPF